MSPLQRKIAITLFSLLLGLIAYTGQVDEVGHEFTEKGFKRALVTFAIARGLNGVISVAQGTEVAIQPAGIGINFTPGQILDPINDLVERFSWVMLASSTSLGLQKLLMTVFSSSVFNLLIIAFLAIWTLTAWWPRLEGTIVKALVYKMALMLVVTRFAIPLMAVGSEFLFSTFLEEQYQNSKQSIEITTTEIGQINRSAKESVPETSEGSLMDKARRLYNNATASLDMDSYIESYKEAAADASEHAINLIVIFLLQTVLLPLLFLWILVRAYRRVVSLTP